MRRIETTVQAPVHHYTILRSTVRLSTLSLKNKNKYNYFSNEDKLLNEYIKYAEAQPCMCIPPSSTNNKEHKQQTAQTTHKYHKQRK